MADVSDRVKSMPPYLFSVIQKKKKELEASGMDIIDLGIGAPDLPTPAFIIDRLVEETKKPNNHRYSTYHGCTEFREAVAAYYKRCYNVEVDPETEVLTLIGSKEGIAHMIMAMMNPGETALIPDPGYPVYRSAVHLIGGDSVYLPLDTSGSYEPKFSEISRETYETTKLMLLNYPSNPTAATTDFNTFLKAVTLARQHDFSLIHDAAYSDLTFKGYKAPSILQVEGAKDVAVEFGSLSKTFNMTGWRIGYAVGNKAMIKALSIVKSNMDTCQFLPIQKAAAEALNSDFSTVRESIAIYEERMEIVLAALKEIGITVEPPKGTFFIWAPVPEGYTSSGFAEKMLVDAGVIITPGPAFGPSGEGYFRLSLSVDTDRLKQAMERMKTFYTKGVQEWIKK
ncbi:LL-diaminopimelate aminotransferase [Thalassobacillus hwangdonensis]|uniref:Aminotransferase n=1 Tax=Thalassobacillus hwangdonensis TaxID=546108 RepID=A0ABW3L0E0_9BACI